MYCGGFESNHLITSAVNPLTPPPNCLSFVLQAQINFETCHEFKVTSKCMRIDQNPLTIQAFACTLGKYLRSIDCFYIEIYPFFVLLQYILKFDRSLYSKTVQIF